MKYKITIFHEILVVCRTVSSLRGGCIYKRVDVTAVRVWCLHFNNYILLRSIIYVILARQKELPEDDVLTSKHVGANRM